MSRLPSRRQREQRAYGLVLATGGLSVVAVVAFALGIVGVISLAPAFLAALVAVLCAVFLRRILRP